jgi:hypothetical protein
VLGIILGLGHEVHAHVMYGHQIALNAYNKFRMTVKQQAQLRYSHCRMVSHRIAKTKRSRTYDLFAALLLNIRLHIAGQGDLAVVGDEGDVGGGAIGVDPLAAEGLFFRIVRPLQCVRGRDTMKVRGLLTKVVSWYSLALDLALKRLSPDCADWESEVSARVAVSHA